MISRYEDVYSKLFKHLKWHRAATITENGQRYTEYITRLENDKIKIFTKKFPRENDARKYAERFENVSILSKSNLLSRHFSKHNH